MWFCVSIGAPPLQCIFKLTQIVSLSFVLVLLWAIFPTCKGSPKSRAPPPPSDPESALERPIAHASSLAQAGRGNPQTSHSVAEGCSSSTYGGECSRVVEVGCDQPRTSPPTNNSEQGKMSSFESSTPIPSGSTCGARNLQ